jgi:hypothetical protein
MPLKPNLILTLLFAISANVHAQQPVAFDGNWLHHGADAYNRSRTATNPTRDDTMSVVALSSFLNGVMQVHRANNQTAALLLAAADGMSKSGSKDEVATGQCTVVITAILTPLFLVPEEVTTGQGISIVDKYLERHPEKLHLPAAKIATEAFKEAFPPSIANQDSKPRP